MKFVLLDRDGVILEYNHDHYPSPGDEIRFVPGAIEAIRDLTAAGFEIIVISNQAGIAKGIVTAEEVEAVMDEMRRKVEEAGGRILDILYCPHADEERCGCRKPEPGMILEAARRHGIEPSETYLVGDAMSDIEAGRRAGTRTILVRSGKAELTGTIHEGPPPDIILDDLAAAARRILEEEG